MNKLILTAAILVSFSVNAEDYVLPTTPEPVRDRTAYDFTQDVDVLGYVQYGGPQDLATREKGVVQHDDIHVGGLQVLGPVEWAKSTSARLAEESRSEDAALEKRAALEKEAEEYGAAEVASQKERNAQYDGPVDPAFQENVDRSWAEEEKRLARLKLDELTSHDPEDERMAKMHRIPLLEIDEKSFKVEVRESVGRMTNKGFANAAFFTVTEDNVASMKGYATNVYYENNQGRDSIEGDITVVVKESECNNGREDILIWSESIIDGKYSSLTEDKTGLLTDLKRFICKKAFSINI